MAHKIKYNLDSVGNFRLLGFATGSYMQKCSGCGLNFIGDKLSFQCLKCAIKLVEKNLNSADETQLKGETSNDSQKCLCYTSKGLAINQLYLTIDKDCPIHGHRWKG